MTQIIIVLRNWKIMKRSGASTASNSDSSLMELNDINTRHRGQRTKTLIQKIVVRSTCMYVRNVYSFQLAQVTHELNMSKRHEAVDFDGETHRFSLTNGFQTLVQLRAIRVCAFPPSPRGGRTKHSWLKKDRRVVLVVVLQLNSDDKDPR